MEDDLPEFHSFIQPFIDAPTTMQLNESEAVDYYCQISRAFNYNFSNGRDNIHGYPVTTIFPHVFPRMKPSSFGKSEIFHRNLSMEAIMNPIGYHLMAFAVLMQCSAAVELRRDDKVSRFSAFFGNQSNC